jgi:hypothetical protein
MKTTQTNSIKVFHERAQLGIDLISQGLVNAHAGTLSNPDFSPLRKTALINQGFDRLIRRLLRHQRAVTASITSSASKAKDTRC